MKHKQQIMKTRIILLALVATFTITTFSSCKKDEHNPTPSPAPTKTDKLAAKSWYLQSMTTNGIDYMSYMDACERDNITNFKTDGTYVIDEGYTKCVPSDPQTTTGVWEFVENDTKMVVDKSDILTVDELTDSTLKVSNIFYEDGQKQTLKATYVAK